MIENIEGKALLLFNSEICSSESNEEIFIEGVFAEKRLDVNKPVVKIMIDNKNIPFRWVFFKGGKESTGTHSFQMGSVQDGQGFPDEEVSLPTLNMKGNLNFNLSIKCEGDLLTTKLNNEWEGTFIADTEMLQASKNILISGGVTVNKAGYSGKV